MKSIIAVFMLTWAMPVLAQQTPAVQGRGDVFAEAQYSNKTIANQWGLEEEEVARYRELMIVEKHYSDPQISPLEVLGKNARNYAESVKYARMAMKKYNEQMVKTLEWAMIFASLSEDNEKQAFDIVSNSPVIRDFLEQGGVDTSVFYRRWQNAVLGVDGTEGSQSSGVPSFLNQRSRVHYFIDLENCSAACDDIWTKIREAQKKQGYEGIDVVFVDSDGVQPTRDDVARWGKSKGITEDEVRNKQITLNWNNARYQEILGDNDLPVAIASNGTLIKQ